MVIDHQTGEHNHGSIDPDGKMKQWHDFRK